MKGYGNFDNVPNNMETTAKCSLVHKIKLSSQLRNTYSKTRTFLSSIVVIYFKK